MDFHSVKDQDVIVWVTRALTVENWTAIREIGVVYDAALVVTTDRATPQSPANADTFTVWSVSLTSHVVAPLLKGVNLRWLEGMRFTASGPEEQAALYDNCRDCAAITYFTAFRYDMPHHMWTSRWMRGGQAVPVWSANVPAGVVWTQVYAGLAEPDGRTLMATWSHFDYGRQKPPDDFVYRYDVDPFSGLVGIGGGWVLIFAASGGQERHRQDKQRQISRSEGNTHFTLRNGWMRYKTNSSTAVHHSSASWNVQCCSMHRL